MPRSGIYGLFDLSGGPLDPRDAATLSLADTLIVNAAAAQGVDRADPGAVQVDRSGGMLTILLGHLDEPAALVGRLGLATATPAAAVARAALARFGEAASAAMIGEWSLLHWDGRGSVTLMLSPARRDPLLYARIGSRLAVSPDLSRLRRIAWVDARIDAEGLLFRLGRTALRRAIGNRTILAGVREVAGGSCVTIAAGGCRVTPAVPRDPAAPWRGSFDDAVDEAEQLLRRIVRARVARTAAPACLLSGGLDSATLAWLASGEGDAGTSLALFSSAAPPGSGLADETGFAALVAERLALPLAAIAPGDDPDIYRPSSETFALANGPSLSVRHYLYDAFADAAVQHGTPLVLDGSYGEMTISGRATLATARYRLGAMLRALRGSAPPPPRGPFHVRLAAHRRDALPPSVRAIVQAPERRARARSPSARWGYFEGSGKILIPATELRAGAVRLDYPYRDTRLLRLFSGFPARFLVQDRLGRAPVRRMLAGALPDVIRLRTTGMPFSPDYLQRMQRHAEQARRRVAMFRAAAVDDWLDLDWLEARLARFAMHGATDMHDAFEVQSTAMAAEFLTWWQDDSR